MTDNNLAVQQPAEIIEQVLMAGDLSKLTPGQRAQYYSRVCQSLELNPLTRPFEYIVLNGKLTLYARKDSTEQLRAKRNVSIIKLERERIEDVYVVTAYATLPNGRQDSSIGAVSIANLSGDALANAMMKAETKAKRRVTLSICGLGMLDELELETISPEAVQVVRPEWVYEDGSSVSDKISERGAYQEYLAAHNGKAPQNIYNLRQWVKKSNAPAEEPAAEPEQPPEV